MRTLAIPTTENDLLRTSSISNNKLLDSATAYSVILNGNRRVNSKSAFLFWKSVIAMRCNVYDSEEFVFRLFYTPTIHVTSSVLYTAMRAVTPSKNLARLVTNFILDKIATRFLKENSISIDDILPRFTMFYIYKLYITVLKATL